MFCFSERPRCAWPSRTIFCVVFFLGGAGCGKGFPAQSWVLSELLFGHFVPMSYQIASISAFYSLLPCLRVLEEERESELCFFFFLSVPVSSFII